MGTPTYGTIMSRQMRIQEEGKHEEPDDANFRTFLFQNKA
jgi:hypothetical protein